MKIIIVGGGVVGRSLAAQLEQDNKNHRITLIDNDFDTCQNVTNKLDILTVHGSGLDPDVLISSGIHDADILLAVTPHDETNVLCCYLASRFGVETRVARLKSTVFNHELFDLKEMGVTNTIEPETEAISEIKDYLHTPSLTEIINFKTLQLAIRGLKISLNSPLNGLSVIEIGELSENKTHLLLYILRNGETIIPSGNTTLFTGDEVYFLMPIDEIDTFRDLVSSKDNKIKKVVISGESPMTISLAQEVEKIAKETVIISEDQEFCKKCADILHDTIIFEGDPASEEALIDAGVHNSNYFISVDEESDENIMSALLAKAEGADNTVAITNDSKHFQLFRTLGIDHIIQPTQVTTQRIFADLTGFNNTTIFKHRKADIEIGQYGITSKSKVVGSSILLIRQDSKIDFIIGGVIRDNKFLIANGALTLNENDQVIIFYNSKNSKVIAKVFKG